MTDGQTLGRLERELPTGPQTPLHWRVRDPLNNGFGIGASWGDWQDALIALIEYRAGQRAAS